MWGFASAGIQILNDRKMRQGHFMMVKEAETYGEGAWVALSGHIWGQRISLKAGNLERSGL